MCPLSRNSENINLLETWESALTCIIIASST
jgi:hypothetical protein